MVLIEPAQARLFTAPRGDLDAMLFNMGIGNIPSMEHRSYGDEIREFKAQGANNRPLDKLKQAVFLLEVANDLLIQAAIAAPEQPRSEKEALEWVNAYGAVEIMSVIIKCQYPYQTWQSDYVEPKLADDCQREYNLQNATDAAKRRWMRRAEELEF